MAELADARDLKSRVRNGRAGSSPALATLLRIVLCQFDVTLFYAQMKSGANPHGNHLYIKTKAFKETLGFGQKGSEAI